MLDGYHAFLSRPIYREVCHSTWQFSSSRGCLNADIALRIDLRFLKQKSNFVRSWSEQDYLKAIVGGDA